MSKPNLDKLLQQKAELEARIQQTRNYEMAEERKKIPDEKFWQVLM